MKLRTIALCIVRIATLSLCVFGCASVPQNGQTERVSPQADEPTSIPIPNELQEKINLSEKLGAELYINDKMAIIGTDLMLEKLSNSQKADICGYIVYREDNGQGQPTGYWWVEFFVDKSEPKVGYLVQITPPRTSGRATTEFKEVTPPKKPSDGELVFYRAVRTALAAIPDRPNQSANPVILPGAWIAEDGILVYLLAATKKDNTVVFGKHYRVLVSMDGRSAKKVEPLTKTALESPIAPATSEGATPFLYVTHLLGDYPLETHVFISLLHHRALYVNTEKYIWRVIEGKVSLVSLRESALNEARAAYKRGDYATAYKKLKFLAVQGDSIAQCGLGSMYELGKGVPKDLAEAARWFRGASDHGNAMGQFELGAMYVDGQGVPKDYAEASKWFRMAAGQGYVRAQCNLGQMYAEGLGVVQDNIQAFMWFSLAVEQGDPNAQKGLEVVAKQMTPAQIAEAKRLASEWKPKGKD